MGDWEEEASVAILSKILSPGSGAATDTADTEHVPSQGRNDGRRICVPSRADRGVVGEPLALARASITKAAPVEETEPAMPRGVACHCMCSCERQPNRRIQCDSCGHGVGPGCCARTPRGGWPEPGATTCICHECLERGPPPQPNPQEEKAPTRADESVSQVALAPKPVLGLSTAPAPAPSPTSALCTTDVPLLHPSEGGHTDSPLAATAGRQEQGQVQGDQELGDEEQGDQEQGDQEQGQERY